MTVEDAVHDLRRAAEALEEDIADERPRQRLRRSVLRPLDQALRAAGGLGGATGRRPRSAARERCRSLTNEEITTTHHVGRAPHSVNREGSP